MVKEFSEDLNSIKKIQSEMKDILSAIKNNSEESNSRVDEAKNQINDLQHKEAKKQPIRTRRRRKNPKQTRIV